MQLPKELISSLLHVQGFNQQAFEQVHNSGDQVTAIRINPSKTNDLDTSHFAFSVDNPVPWSSFGYYLSQRPSFTFDPFFHAGCYYVQDASSMFLEEAVKQSVDITKPLRVLDLCAAPGGKSTHLQSLISSESLLISNEVIKNRAGILKQNIYKWGSENVIVTNNDPQHFKKLEGFFDVIVIDAPCSGSGLFRKDAAALAHWSKDNVQLCCGRQKRIISDAIDSLKEGGVLIYSTCSYSREEDEDIADWLVKEWNMENIKLTVAEDWGIVETISQQTQSYGYRFFPDRLKGEGFYLSVFRKTTNPVAIKYKSTKLEKATLKENVIIKLWLVDKELTLLKEYFFYALPSTMVEDYSIIKAALNVQYAGVAIGEIMKERLVPEHALAASSLVSSSIAKIEINYEEAILYLQKAEVKLNPSAKGWQLLTYQNRNLGWINALQNRVNNYYPKELRILKQHNDSPFGK